MLPAPVPSDEAERLELVRSCGVLHSPAEQAFDDVAQLAAELCGTEMALITIVDANEQWFKARVGLDASRGPRDSSFCGHCIVGDVPLVVEDAKRDPRFSDNPFVIGDPFIRFYAGVPLSITDGSAVGALCVVSRTPRKLDERQLDALRRLARQVSRELGLRRELDRARSVGPRASSSLDVSEGHVLGGRWTVTRELGRGSTGAVFEARNAAGERAAVKVLLPEWRVHDEVLERFAREARVLMRLRTPHVGRLLDVGNLDSNQGDLPFIVLEYLEGVDLERMLQTQGRIGWRDAFDLCADACKGVAAAHDLGVIHRDLKPSNIFLANTGEDTVVKVLDFGIAAGEPMSASPSKLTRDNLVGTPAYMSPEQMVGGPVGTATDVWAMGAVLYETIAGALPFEGTTHLELFASAMTKPPLPLAAHIPDLPPEVEEIVMRCLRKRPEDRIPTMRALALALRGAIS